MQTSTTTTARTRFGSDAGGVGAAGALWIIAGLFAAYMFVANGPNLQGENVRSEFAAGFSQGFNGDDDQSPAPAPVEPGNPEVAANDGLPDGYTA